jgi:hypothetical protein
MLRNEQRLGARLVNRGRAGGGAQLNAERIALAALRGPELSTLQQMLAAARDRNSEALATVQLAAHSDP